MSLIKVYVDKSPVTSCKAVSHSDDSRPVLKESMVCLSKDDSPGTEQVVTSHSSDSSLVLDAYKAFVSLVKCQLSQVQVNVTQ